MKKYFNNYNIYSSVLLVCVITLISTFFSYPYLSNDCGYYLQVMNDIYNGKLYFKEIATPYNPLGILILSIPKILLNPTDSRHHLLINIIVMVLSSYLLFKILNTQLQNKKINFFFSLLFLSTCLIYDGAFLMLEPISILFLLIGLTFYIKHRKKINYKFLFLVGLFISLAFLTKQYALFVLLPIGIDILLRKKHFIKEIIILSIGIVLPIVILFFFYSYHDVSIIQYIKYISGKGVNLDKGNGTGINSAFNTTGLINYLILYIFILFTPFLLKNKAQKSENIIFFILLLLASLSVFTFASYYHYFQYLFPFTLILIAYSLNKKSSFINKKIFHAALVISSIMVFALTIKSITGQKTYYERQATNEKILLNAIPKNAVVYLSGIRPAFYYLGNYKSINLKDIGYSFPGYFYPETIVKNLKKGNYLVLTNKYLDNYEKYLDEFEKQTILFMGKNKLDTKVYILKKK